MLIIGVAKGRGGHPVSQEVVDTDTPKIPFGRLLCETNHAILANQCLTAPVMCTVPDPSPRPSHLHQLSSLRPAIGQSGDVNPLGFSNAIQYSIKRRM